MLLALFIGMGLVQRGFILNRRAVHRALSDAPCFKYNPLGQSQKVGRNREGLLVLGTPAAKVGGKKKKGKKMRRIKDAVRGT
jgi:hypothetical protein